MEPITDILRFVSLTNQFQQIKRAVLVTGEDRYENDAEHTCQLALAGWYIASAYFPQLDTAKIIKLALSHDLLELLTGDTCAHASVEERQLKLKRELEALPLLKDLNPLWLDLPKYLDEYLELSSDESKFVSALDKLLPLCNIYLDGGKSWQLKNIKLESVEDVVSRKITPTSLLYPVFTKLLEVIKSAKIPNI